MKSIFVIVFAMVSSIMLDCRAAICSDICDSSWIFSRDLPTGECQTDTLEVNLSNLGIRLPLNSLICSYELGIAIHTAEMNKGSGGLEMYGSILDAMAIGKIKLEQLSPEERKFANCLIMAKKMGSELCICDFIKLLFYERKPCIFDIDKIEINEEAFIEIVSYSDKSFEGVGEKTRKFYSFMNDDELVGVYTYVDLKTLRYTEIFGSIFNTSDARKLMHCILDN